MREEIQKIQYETNQLQSLTERGRDIIAELRRLIEGKDGPEAGAFHGVFTIERNGLTTPHSLLVSFFGLHLLFRIELTHYAERAPLGRLVAYSIHHLAQPHTMPMDLEYQFDKLGNVTGSIRDGFGLEFLERVFEVVQQKKLILRPSSPVPSHVTYEAAYAP